MEPTLSNGQNASITVDGDDGSPGLQPTQGLIRFDNIIGAGPGQLDPNTSIDQALLVLEIDNAGSGFDVHEMLATWDENSTWQGFNGGVQADGVEAASAVLASFGVDDDSENVSDGTLEIDVTSSIQKYLNGTAQNLGLGVVAICKWYQWNRFSFERRRTNRLASISADFPDLSSWRLRWGSRCGWHGPACLAKRIWNDLRCQRTSRLEGQLWDSCCGCRGSCARTIGLVPFANCGDWFAVVPESSQTSTATPVSSARIPVSGLQSKATRR